MNVGYFKIKSAPLMVVDRSRMIPSRLPERHLSSVGKRSKIIALPVTGFLLALMLLTGMQVGVRLSDQVATIDPSVVVRNLASINFSLDRYQILTKVELPNNVSFLANVYSTVSGWFNTFWSWVLDLFNKITQNWWGFLSGEREIEKVPVTTADLRSEIKQEIIEELKQQYGSNLGLLAVPSLGSTTSDAMAKEKMAQIFADKVDVKFDDNNSSGVVTPVFRDGRKGGDYVFILTPLK